MWVAAPWPRYVREKKPRNLMWEDPVRKPFFTYMDFLNKMEKILWNWWIPS
jgi:hypothetical protein